MSKTICIYPHPDDEAAMAFTLKQLNEISGNELLIYYVTSGKNGSDLTDPGITPEDLGLKREAEATAALLALGIPGSKITFMRLDDDIADLVVLNAAIKAIFDAESPDVIFSWGPTGGYGSYEHQQVWVSCNYVTMLQENSSPKLFLQMEFSKTKEDLLASYGVAGFTATPTPDERLALVNPVQVNSTLFTSYVDNYPSQFDSIRRLAFTQLNTDYPYDEFTIGYIQDGLSTDWDDITEAVALEAQATNSVTASSSWASLKTSVENYIQQIETDKNLGVQSVRRQDGSETTFQPLSELIKAYQSIKKESDREAMNRNSSHRPIKIRSSSMRY